jgi:hypothetical protein
MKQRVTGLLVSCAFVCVNTANAQFGREGTWMTSGGNAQRSAWVRTDSKITNTSVLSGFQLLWKIKLDRKGSLTEPLIMDRYIGYQGFRSFALMGGVDGIYAVDTDLNRIEWQKPLSSEEKGNSNCSSGTIADVALHFDGSLPLKIPVVDRSLSMACIRATREAPSNARWMFLSPLCKSILAGAMAIW